MRVLGDSGVWEIFIPDLGAGELYKYEIKSPGLPEFLKADPYAAFAEVRPPLPRSSYESNYKFRDSQLDEEAGEPRTFSPAAFDL